MQHKVEKAQDTKHSECAQCSQCPRGGTVGRSGARVRRPYVTTRKCHPNRPLAARQPVEPTTAKLRRHAPNAIAFKRTTETARSIGKASAEAHLRAVTHRTLLTFAEYATSAYERAGLSLQCVPHNRRRARARRSRAVVHEKSHFDCRATQAVGSGDDSPPPLDGAPAAIPRRQQQKQLWVCR